MQISDLPQEIQALVFKKQQQQGNEPDNTLDLIESVYNGNFEWNKTEEGDDFWGNIHDGYYDCFYEQYSPNSDPNYSIF